MSPEREPRPDPSLPDPRPDLSEDELREFVDKLGLPEDQKTDLIEAVKALRIERVSKSKFSGPLPHPDNFERYEQIFPGAAERILSIAEKNLQIRADRQKGVIANERMKIIGATWVGTLLIVAAGLMGWIGNNVIALPLGIVGTLNLFLRWLMDRSERHGSAR